jgi:divalent metal cation (Fe/Co/Zn/Cd) transporter
VIALAVAVNIVVTGVVLVRRASGGLLDRSLPDAERAAIERVHEFGGESARFHALRIRQAGRRSFASVRVLVPGRWSVQRGHDLLEWVEAAVRAVLPGLILFTHLEPLEDPASQADTGLERADVAGQPAHGPAAAPSPRPH